MTDPVELTAELIRCPSVTPDEGGAISLLETLLSDAGFRCTRIERGGIQNLYARFGDSGPVFGFNGHTDVVPVGDEDAWSHLPFGATLVVNELYGRGATDMKSGVAAFVSAAIDTVREGIPGSIVIMITGDEEGPAVDGTRAILDWMVENGEKLDHCLVGEPTSRDVFGDMMKIGRRGSLNAHLRARGKQGHVAYPHRALNPITALVSLLHRLSQHTLDNGTEHFDPSTLAVTTVDVGNTATNVIPAEARATINIRFNDAHSGYSLTGWLEEEVARSREETGVEFDVDIQVSGESFLTPPGTLSDLIGHAVQEVSGHRPELSTSGGTSDARFLSQYFPVVEFGLTGRTMHQTNERVSVKEIDLLKQVYARLLQLYFAAQS